MRRHASGAEVESPFRFPWSTGWGMSDWLMRTIKAEAKSLLELAVEDAELRQDLRVLAQEILAATAASEPGAESAVAALASTSPVEESVVQGPSASEAAEVDSNRGSERLKELTLGRSPLPERPSIRSGDDEAA